MAKKRRKPLTKAEAGRLGGKATVRKYGPEHMRTIGKAGFQAFARKLGYMGGSRLGAIQWLQRNRKFPGMTPVQHAAPRCDGSTCALGSSCEPKDPRMRGGGPGRRDSWRRSGRHRRPRGRALIMTNEELKDRGGGGGQSRQDPR